MALSIRNYKKNECITFKSTKGKFGALSNMAPGFPIQIGDITIRNSEVLYQALRFPEFPDIQSKILSFPSPISAKKYGREHIEKSRADWNQNRFRIMKFCIEIKLHQNLDTFSSVLLQTKKLPIVEYTDIDKVWGATDEGDMYSGTNALGRLLMELRENVRNNTFKVEIPDIKDLKIMNRQITMEAINSAPNTLYK